jgi:hypothetical protein
MMGAAAPGLTSPATLGLEVIEGLGPSSADRLRAAGVRTLADLARFADAEQLFEHLQARSVSDVPLRRILNERGAAGDWVTQAHQRQGGVWVVDFEIDRTAELPQWTTTVSSEESHVEQQFDGVDPDVWATWLIAQSGLPAHHQEEVEAATGDDSWLRVASVDVVQPERGAPTLVADVEVWLSGGDVAGVTSDAPFFVVDLVAVPMKGGPPQRLASYHQRFAPGVESYSVTLTFPVPLAGTYQLYCLAFSPSAGVCFEGAFGPALEVIERPRAAS